MTFDSRSDPETTMTTLAKLLAAFAFLTLALSAVPSRADQATDEAAIKQLGLKWQDAWNSETPGQ